jgi:hypothetical protein
VSDWLALVLLFLKTFQLKEFNMTPYTTLVIPNATVSPQELIAKAEQLDHAGQTHEALELYRNWLKNDRTHSKYSVWFIPENWLCPSSYERFC